MSKKTSSGYTDFASIRTILFVVSIITILIIVIVAGIVASRNNTTQRRGINTFEECVAAGNPIMESYPEQCMTKDGRSFTRELPENQLQNKNIELDMNSTNGINSAQSITQ